MLRTMCRQLLADWQELYSWWFFLKLKWTKFGHMPQVWTWIIYTHLLNFLRLIITCCRVKSVLNIQWKDWCWSWNSNTLATWCEEPTHWKRPWYWETLKAGGEVDDRGWDGWMISPTRWTSLSMLWELVGKGQGSPACCNPGGHKESDMTEQLNWTEGEKRVKIFASSMAQIGEKCLLFITNLSAKVYKCFFLAIAL